MRQRIKNGIVHFVSVAILVFICLPLFAAKSKSTIDRKNHEITGFVLEGAHSKADCASCHVRGVFKGTPRGCVGCHVVGGRIKATAKHSQHIKSTNECDSCHLPKGWKPARTEHTEVLGSCFACHNGVIARGKGPKHITSANTCNDCHTTVSWDVSKGKVDHSTFCPALCVLSYQTAGAYSYYSSL